MSEANAGAGGQRAEINILLLGESGVGKTTTIAALAAYLRYDTYEAALESGENFHYTIPTQFVWSAGRNRVQRIRAPGTVSNRSENVEASNMARSATRTPVSYLLDYGNVRLRIIDCPGFGDSDGQDYDEAMFEHTLSYLHSLQKLHAIVFVLSNAQSRRTSFYKYTTTAVLKRLPGAINSRLWFLFTNSTSMGVSTGFTVLEETLQSYFIGLGFRLDIESNVYFIENNGYRAVLAHAVDSQVPLQNVFYSTFWKESYEELKRLLNKIVESEPIDVASHASIHYATMLLKKLMEPFLKNHALLHQNLQNIRQKLIFLKSENDSIEQLRCAVSTKRSTLRAKELASPSTVCASSLCLEMVDGNPVFKSECHKGCWCQFVDPNTTQQPMLRLCQCMDWLGRCKKCRCSWRDHLHTSMVYRMEAITDSEMDTLIGKINSKEQLMATTKQLIEKLESFKGELKKELDVVQLAVIDLSSYIRRIYTKAEVESYLNPYFQSQVLLSMPDYDIRGFQAELYRRIEDSYAKVRAKTGVAVDDARVLAIRDQLSALKHSGNLFKSALSARDNITAAVRRNLNYDEMLYSRDQ